MNIIYEYDYIRITLLIINNDYFFVNMITKKTKDLDHFNDSIFNFRYLIRPYSFLAFCPRTINHEMQTIDVWITTNKFLLAKNLLLSVKTLPVFHKCKYM